MVQIRTYYTTKSNGAGVVKATSTVNGKRRTVSVNYLHSDSRNGNHRIAVELFVRKFIPNFAGSANPNDYDGPAYRGTGVVGDNVCDYWNVQTGSVDTTSIKEA